MGLLGWLVLGFLAGALAQVFVPVDRRGGCRGCIVTIVIGLAGAVVGGFIGTQLGWGKVRHFDARSLALAFTGAVVVLLVLRAVRDRR
jgi:uncharacterized membrane protein YeaQ/YmgE (transglycosylase-associated protein family)